MKVKTLVKIVFVVLILALGVNYFLRPDYILGFMEVAGKKAPLKSNQELENEKEMAEKGKETTETTETTPQGEKKELSEQDKVLAEKEPVYDFKALKNLKDCSKHHPWGSHLPNDSKKEEDLYQVCKKSYVVMFDKKKKQTLWAAEVFENDYTRKPMVDFKTTDLKYSYDNNIPKKEQIFVNSMMVQDFIPSPLVPLSDFNWDRYYLNETLETSNYLPMNKKVAQTIWKEAEVLGRRIAEKRDKVFITSGALYLDNKVVNGVSIPSHFYKAFFTTRKESLVFLIPNKDCGDKCSLSNYRTYYDELEKLGEFKMHVDLASYYRDDLMKYKAIGITLND